MKATVLVLESTGDLGRGVVAAALAAGHRVIAASADAAALRALQAKHPRAALLVLPGHTDNDAAAAALAADVQARGERLDAIVAAAGYRGAAGRLLEQPVQVLHMMLDDYLSPHLHAARHLFALLRHGERVGYLMVAAAGREYPWAGHGPGSVAAAALPMLARVLHDEAARDGVRVQLLALTTPVCGDSNRGHACSEWPSALSIGHAVVALLDRRASEAKLPAVVEFSTLASTLPRHHAVPGTAVQETSPQRDAAPPCDAPPQRCDLRRARALLKSLVSLPSAGHLTDEERH